MRSFSLLTVDAFLEFRIDHYTQLLKSSTNMNQKIFLSQQLKQFNDEQHTPVVFGNRNYSLDMERRNKGLDSFDGFGLLSEGEKEVYEGFVDLKRESLWQHAIKKVISTGNAYSFRKLICDLKSQANDNLLGMEDILGYDLCTKMMAL